MVLPTANAMPAKISDQIPLKFSTSVAIAAWNLVANQAAAGKLENPATAHGRWVCFFDPRKQAVKIAPGRTDLYGKYMLDEGNILLHH